MLFGQATALWRRQRTPAEAVYIGRQQVLGLIARTPTTHPRYVISDRTFALRTHIPPETTNAVICPRLRLGFRVTGLGFMVRAKVRG